MPGTGSPQAQKGSTKWLLTRTSIHRVVLLSTLGFYTLTHTHTHTHTTSSLGAAGSQARLAHTRVASPTLVWPHPEPHALKPRQRSRLRAPGDFPTSSTLPLHLPVGMSSGPVYHSRSSTLRQRGALTLSTRPCLPAPCPWGSGFLLPQAPPGPYPLGMLGVGLSQMELPTDSFLSLCTGFRVLEKFPSKASEKIGKERSYAAPSVSFGMFSASEGKGESVRPL